jgi:hypothetical protein
MTPFSKPVIAVAVLVCIAAGTYLGRSLIVEAGGSAPAFSATTVSYRWVYQPNGTTDLVNGVSDGFARLAVGEGLVFNTQVVGDTNADVYYLDQTCPCPGPTGPGFWANNGLGGVHDLGPVDFAGVTTAPNKSLGVGYGQYYHNGETPVEVGHVYVLVTNDGEDYARLIVDSITLASADYARGDVNCSGTVNSVDALLTLRHNAGLAVNLPPGCWPLGN